MMTRNYPGSVAFVCAGLFLLSDGDIEAEVGGVYAIPTTFILDRVGGVRHMHVGLVQKEVLQDEIRALL